jgi:DNA-binding response OmpR family regulator
MLVRAGGMVLDVTRREVRFRDAAIVLSEREFRLLHMLVEHAGEVVTRESLLETVWGYTFDPGSNVVEVCIRRVRRKLGPEAPIETVHHAGYRLAAA